MSLRFLAWLEPKWIWLGRLKNLLKIEVAAAAVGRRGDGKKAQDCSNRKRPVAEAAQASSDRNRRAQSIPHLGFFTDSIGIKFCQEYRTKIPLALGARR